MILFAAKMCVFIRYFYARTETVLLSGHLALEVSSTFAWGRWVQRHLLPVASVNDVIVSEVFHNVSVWIGMLLCPP